MEDLKLYKSYRDDDVLRRSLSALARKTFGGLDFEDWYQNGFWGDGYTPYSFVARDKVVANVSVNTTDFLWDGVCRHFIQLGTVMTDTPYRNRGLIRRLMEEIERDYADKVDGAYLFANDSVREFYPKFGFCRAAERQYSRPVQSGLERTAEQAPMRDPGAWAVMKRAIEKSAPCGRFSLLHNSGLPMFHISKFMQENVYFIPSLQAYAVAEIEDGVLYLHAVYAEEQPEPDAVVQAFGGEVRQAVLNFTPRSAEGYTAFTRHEPDTTLFVKGGGFAGFDEAGLMFPTLAYA